MRRDEADTWDDPSPSLGGRRLETRSKMVMRALPSILVFGTAMMIVGCGGMFEGKEAAEHSVVDFHKMYNDGKLAEIYAAGHPNLKGTTSEKEFLEFVGTVQRKLGNVTRTSNTGLNVRTVNSTTTVVMAQDTTFEHGTGTETFTFEMDGDRAVLIGYHINSKDLIMK